MAVQPKPPPGQTGANSATTYTTQQLYPAGTGSTSRVPPLPSTSNNVSRRGATAADLSRSVEYVYHLSLLFVASNFQVYLKLFSLSKIQWKLDLADTDLAENLDLKDTLQKIWATIFDF